MPTEGAVRFGMWLPRAAPGPGTAGTVRPGGQRVAESIPGPLCQPVPAPKFARGVMGQLTPGERAF